jgi:hypothetical protein
MSIRLAVRPLVLLRNRLAVERKRPWLVKAQNSLRLWLWLNGAQIRAYRVGIYLLTGISENTEVSCIVNRKQSSLRLSVYTHTAFCPLLLAMVSAVVSLC